MLIIIKIVYKKEQTFVQFILFPNFTAKYYVTIMNQLFIATIKPRQDKARKTHKRKFAQKRIIYWNDKKRKLLKD
jgi:hypothetical protein